MGAILSHSNPSCRTSNPFETSQNEGCKRQKMSSSFGEENSRLFSSLPGEISIQILARLPRIYYLDAKLVSRSWKAAITSPELFKIRKELGTTEQWVYILTKTGGDKLSWFALDPVSTKWQRLPSMPDVSVEEGSGRRFTGLRIWDMVGSSIKIADAIKGWLFARRDALDYISLCGCSIGAVDGCLYVLGGFFKASAVKYVWRYDPILNVWCEVTPMSTGRAYCKTGVLNNKLYVVGGVSRVRSTPTPLQSAEVFDPLTGSWSEVPSMPFSKAQVLPTAFLADLLKPIATGITSYRGKLYVPQSLYCWPFFVDVGGEVYDPETNSWVEMPMGMGDGWPARQAGTKLSVIVDGDLYALDPSNSVNSGAKIKKYDYQDDAWKVLEGDVPIHDFTDSESPYLLAGFLGKLHVITKTSNSNISVMQAQRENHSSSCPSTSSTPSEHFGSGIRPETNVWKIIATRNARSLELISCQILDI